MNKNEKGTFLYIAFIVAAGALISLPGFLFFYFKAEAGILVSAFIGLIIGGFILSAIDALFALLSLPRLLKRKPKKN
jgi:hypothetical protein